MLNKPHHSPPPEGSLDEAMRALVEKFGSSACHESLRRCNEERNRNCEAVLPGEILTKILLFVGDPKAIISSFGTVCRSYRKAARAPHVWYELACIKYGKEIAEASGSLYGGDWRDLMVNDNKRGAFPTLSITPIVCMYRSNQNHYFFCCIVQGVKWDRVANELRLYLDVRGETDLRHPESSSIACTVQSTPIRRFYPQRRAEPFRTHSVLPTRFVPEIEPTVGHYKGYLSFPANHFTIGGRYKFCYANTQLNSYTDYELVDLFQIPPKGGLRDAFKTHNNVQAPLCEYTLDESPFRDDTPEVERERWETHVPSEVMNRHHRWYL